VRIVAELVWVFAVMLGVKRGADALGVLGAGSLAMWCGVLVATFLMRRRGASWRDLGLSWPKGAKSWASTVGWALVAIVSVFAAMGLVIEPITTALGLETPASAADRFQVLMGHPGRLIAYLVVVVWLGAALGEELQMRGFVLNRLADLFGRGKAGWGAAVATQAVVFGSLHVYQGLHGVISMTVIGAVLALVYLGSGRRLLPVVIGHGVINTIILVALYLHGGVIQ
jgi:membrane protease YdiL (CAAX protease family)